MMMNDGTFALPIRLNCTLAIHGALKILFLLSEHTTRVQRGSSCRLRPQDNLRFDTCMPRYIPTAAAAGCPWSHRICIHWHKTPLMPLTTLTIYRSFVIQPLMESELQTTGRELQTIVGL
jgi:hypothetical protein